jgi:uncharacterized repeat protein (TIGR01451 family)
VTAAADLAVTKSDSPDRVHIGQTLTYTLTVKNNGGSNASGVTGTDTLPKTTGFVSATASQGTACAYNKKGGTVTCGLGGLASGATATSGSS